MLRLQSLTGKLICISGLQGDLLEPFCPSSSLVTGKFYVSISSVPLVTLCLLLFTATCTSYHSYEGLVASNKQFWGCLWPANLQCDLIGFLVFTGTKLREMSNLSKNKQQSTWILSKWIISQSSFCQGTHRALHLYLVILYTVGCSMERWLDFQKSQYESVAEPEKGVRNLCSLTHPTNRSVLLQSVFEDVRKQNNRGTKGFFSLWLQRV